MKRLLAKIVLIGSCLVLIALLGPALGRTQQVGRASQVMTAIGIDADPSGNSAASLGEIDACVSVAAGGTFDVDIFVADVTDLAGWQATFRYDASVVSLVGTNVELFLAVDEGSSVIDLSDVLPDDDGIYRFGVADMALTTVGHSGSGVLARVTLQAVGAGSSILTLASVKLGDAAGWPIGDTDGNTFFDGGVSSAQVWVDEPCPSPLPTLVPPPSPTVSSAASPTTVVPSPRTATVEPSSPTAATPGSQPVAQPLPAEGEEEGAFPWAVVAGASAAAIVVALASGLALVWLRRRIGG